jgi:hypothetical protein
LGIDISVRPAAALNKKPKEGRERERERERESSSILFIFYFFWHTKDHYSSSVNRVYVISL